MLRIRPGLGRWLPRLGPLLWAVALASAAQAQHPLLAPGPANENWHAPQASNEADYIGDPAAQTPIVLNKAPFANGAVTFTIDSDADHCILRSGTIEVAIDLIPEKTSKLRFDGNLLHPRVMLNDRELGPQRGRWIRLLTRSTQPTFTLVFVNAKYVNLEFAISPGPNAPENLPARAPTLAPAAPLPGTPMLVPSPGVPAPTAQPAAAPGVAQVESPVISTQAIGAQAQPPTQPVAPNIQPQPAASLVPSDAVPVKTQPPTNSPGAPVARYATPSAVALPPEPDDHAWKLSLKAGVITTNAYYYRGIGQEDKDPIVQPFVDVDIRLYNKPESTWFNSLDATVELWNTFDWGPTGYDGADRHGGRDKYYEERFSGGIEVRLFRQWLLALDQQTRLSPNGRLFAIHQMDMRLTFDDHSPDYDWQLWPYALGSIEYEGQSDAGNGQPDHKGPFQLGDYLELGVRPEFGLYKFDVDKELTVDVPVAVGMSMHDYYQDATGRDNVFGFADVGAEFSLPLLRARADPGRHIELDWVAGVHFLLLGQSVRDISRENGTNASTLDVIGSTGLVFTY